MKTDRKKAQMAHIKVLTEFMSSRHLYEDSMETEIPYAADNYGGLLLFTAPAFSHPNWQRAGEDLWRLVCSLFKGHSVGVKGHIKNDDYRSPQAKLIWGKTPLATFTDNGIQYRWNIEKTMFSRGNVTERHRIAQLDCSDEVVVDLFAGIGYFTIPYLVHAKAKHVHACEWNPDAVTALRDNLTLNKVADKCTIYEGDNRRVCPKRIANRVNLGLIPSSEISWETACQALLPKGGVLYIHQNVESNVNPDKPLVCATCANLLENSISSLDKNCVLPVKVFTSGAPSPVVNNHDDLNVRWKWPEWYHFSLHLSHVILDYLVSSHGGTWNVHVTDVFRVKSYAPHIDHLVFSIKCQGAIEWTSNPS